MQIHVVPVSWEERRAQLRSVREAVFIEEQGVPREIEWDGEDDQATHVLAVTETGQPVGCARLLRDGRIGRMAVLPAHRGTGLGRRLLDVVIEEAKRQGLTQVTLHAQTQAEPFYRKAGFLPVGNEFIEAGIPHQAMELELPIPFEAPSVAARPVVRPSTASGSSEPDPLARLEQYHGETDCLLGLLRSLEVPRRRLAIFSHSLDHILFDQEPLIDAVSRFARSAPNAEIRVLITDSSPIVSRGHRFLELARRLDSHIEIRRVPDELSPGEASFVVWDEQGLFLLPDYREYTAMVNLYDPVQSKHLTEQFDYYWARSSTDPELRVLRL